MKKSEKNVDKKIAELEEKVGGLTAGWQRTQADFLNYKKQVADERIDLIKSANSDLIYQLIPVLDNFRLAATHMPDELRENNWAIGVKQIEKQFEDILSSVGLTKIDAVGEEFDPRFHEAIEEVASDQNSGVIVEEVLGGYILNGKVLRVAKVKVSK